VPAGEELSPPAVAVRRPGDEFRSTARRREEAMTTTTNERTELAHRSSDGIEVHLFWNERTDRVTVGVLDARTDDSFEVEVDGRLALDAFNHPFAYAGAPHTARRPAGQTIDLRRTDHARSDR
jgi:hypothetical protein